MQRKAWAIVSGRPVRAPSGPLRTLVLRWKTRRGRSAPASEAGVRALVDALGVSPTTASVLVRRGYAEPSARAVVPRGRAARATTRSRSATCPRRCERIRAAVAAGARICVHGDYDADGICATSLAVLLLRELGAEPEWHLPSRFEEGYGLASQTIERLAADGVDLVLTVDCGITARRRGRRGAPARARDRRHGSPPARRARHVPGVPGRGAARRRARLVPVRRAVRDRRRLEARRGAARPGPPVPRAAPRRGRARDGRRRRAARRREPRARAARPAPARADAEARAAGADARRRRRSGRVRGERDRLPARAADQRRRPPRPPRGGARAAARPTTRARRRGSPRTSRC